MEIKLAVLAGTILAPIALVLIAARSNRRKEERYKQCFRPWIALAFTVLCCIYFSKLTWAVDWLLNQPFMAPITQWIQQVASSSIIYSTKLYGAYILNIGVLVGYYFFKIGYWGVFSLAAGIIRFFARLIFRKKKKAKTRGTKKRAEQDIPDHIENLRGPVRWYWEFLDLFYHIDDRTALVRSKWLTAGRVGTYAFSILGTLYLVLLLFAQLPLVANLSWYPFNLVERWMDSCYLWPAISAVAILECLFFFGGKETYDMPEDTEKEEDDDEETAVDYTPLIEIYERQFADRFVGSLKVTNYPRQHEEANPQTDLTQGIYNRLLAWKKDNKRTLDKAVLDCIASLPERENTVIDAQLSDDFGECLMLYVNVLLTRGENLLIICRDEETCENIGGYVEKTLQKINGLMPVWIVRSVRDAYQSSDCDVLVLPPDAVMNQTVKSAQQRFFRNLSTVLIIDVSRLFAEMGTLLMAVTAQLATERDIQIQYIALCNGMPNELRTTLEQSLSPGRDFRAYECFSSNDTTRIMLWNYEPAGEGKVITAQSLLFQQAMDRVYLGVAVPLACVALKNGVENVSIMGNRIPKAQIMDAMRLGFSLMNNYFDCTLTSDELSIRLLFQEISSPNPFVIVLDDTYNLPMTIRNNCRYIGKSCAMVHIISKPYMLRDYFAAHATEYLLDKVKMEMFSSILRDNTKTAALRLIFEASREDGLSEEHLMNQLRSMGCAPESLRDALEKCFSIAYNGETTDTVENYFAVRTRCSFNQKENKFVYQRYITLKDDSLLSRLTGEILPALLIIGEEEIRLGIPKGDIYRYYLPDQAIIVNNCMYYIDAMDSQKGIVHVGRKIENLELATEYLQHRHYSLATDRMRTERKVSFEVNIGTALEQRIKQFEVEMLRDVEITVDTMGFLTHHPSYPHIDLTCKAQYRLLNDKVRADAKRTINKGSAIAVRFIGVEPQHADHISITMAVLLSELMKTLFPYNWPCIAVCPVLHDAVNDADEEVSFERLGIVYPQVTCPTDWPHATDTAEILILEDSQKDLGILDTLFRNRQNPLSTAITMLRDYLEWQSTFYEKENDNIRNNYLYFGAEHLPGYFDLKYVEDMLRQMEVTHPVSMEEDPFLKSNLCYFCQKNLLVTDFVVLRDEYGKMDRKVCTDCAKRLLNKKEDLMPLFEQTKSYLCDTFKITLPKRINVKFVSATKIRRQLKRNHKHRRVIGLAQSITKTVWAETNSPKEYILRILVHELTHIWQFENISCDDLSAMEGHASLMEVRYMHDLGYYRLEKRTDEELRSRLDDEYGSGYVKITEALKSKGSNPFTYMAERYPKIK